MKNINSSEGSTEETSSPSDFVTSNTRSRLAMCFNGVETVANTGAFITGRVAKIGLTTSAALIKGLVS